MYESLDGSGAVSPRGLERNDERFVVEAAQAAAGHGRPDHLPTELLEAPSIGGLDAGGGMALHAALGEPPRSVTQCPGAHAILGIGQSSTHF